MHVYMQIELTETDRRSSWPTHLPPSITFSLNADLAHIHPIPGQAETLQLYKENADWLMLNMAVLFPGLVIPQGMDTLPNSGQCVRSVTPRKVLPALN